MPFSHIFDEGLYKLLISAKQIAQFSEEQKNRNKKKILKLPLKELLSSLDDYLMDLPDSNSSHTVTFSDKILIINCREILCGVSVIFDMEIKSLFQACKRNVSRKEKILKLHSEALNSPKISKKVPAKIALDEPKHPIGEEVLSFHDLPQRQISPEADKALPPTTAVDELRTTGWPVLEDFVTPFLETSRVPRETMITSLPQEMPIPEEVDVILPEMEMPKVEEIHVATVEPDMLEKILAEADMLIPEKIARVPTAKIQRPLLYHEQHSMSNEAYKNFLNRKLMEVLMPFEDADNFIKKRYYYFKKREEDQECLSDDMVSDYEDPYDFLPGEHFSTDVGPQGSYPVREIDSLREGNIVADLDVTGQQPSQRIDVHGSHLDMFVPEEINMEVEGKDTSVKAGLAVTLPESPSVLRDPHSTVSLPQVPLHHSLMTPTMSGIPLMDLINVSTLSTSHLKNENFLLLSEEMVLNKLKVLCRIENEFTTSFTDLCPYYESRFKAAVLFKLLISLWGRNQVYLNQTSSHPSDINIRLNISSVF